MQRNYQIAALIGKFLRDDISEEDQLVLEKWLQEHPGNQEILDSFKGDRLVEDIDYLESLQADELWEELRKARSRQLRKRYIRIARYAAAAVLISAFSWLGLFLSNQKPNEVSRIEKSNYINDVLPGGDKAQLILSDGRTVDLGAYLSGFSEQDGTQIRGNDGEIIYSTGQAATDLIYNVLVVPEKGKYNLTLSDGTKVWLNAMSELHFPVLFNNQERSVTLTGEAYFEVAHDPDRPFYVNVNDSKIEVLGTHFNINSYRDIKTTLFEGSIKISNETDEQVLVPGQEALIDKRITVQQANLEKVIAWKNGNFFFEGDNILEVMEQLSRWYGVHVVYRSKAQENMLYTGTISRDVNLSEVLEMLTFVGDATFLLDESQVTVEF